MKQDQKFQYTLDQAEEDFGAGALAQGAENVLAEAYPDAVFTKNRDIDTTDPAGKTVVIRSRFSEPEGGICESRICLDEEQGELVYSYCTCHAFSANWFRCEHTMTLLMKYLIKKSGRDCLKDSRTFKELVRRTGTEDPFIPGILRRSDPRLKALISRGDGSDILFSPEEINRQTQETAAKPLTVEYYLKPARGSVLVSMKAGGGRLYIVRNIPELMKAYADNSSYRFSGKTILRAGRGNYTAEAQKSMDILYDSYLQYNRVHTMQESVIISKWNYGDIRLDGMELDRFLQALGGSDVYVSTDFLQNDRCRVSLSQKPSAVVLQKEPYGAYLKLPEFRMIGCGAAAGYLWQPGVILSVPAGQWELREELAKIRTSTQQFYIRDQDLKAVLSALTPLLQEEGQLMAEGFELGEYLPQSFLTEICLDLAGENYITCEVCACYQEPAGRYSVFAPDRDRRLRNLQEERKTALQISSYFTGYEEEKRVLYFTGDESELFHFLSETIPALDREGDVLVSDTLKKIRVRPAGRLTAGIRMEAGNLILSLQSEDMDLSEMTEWLGSYDRRKKYTRLKNGTFLTFSEQDEALWEALSETFRAYGKKHPQAMKIPSFRALYLEELLKDREEILFSEGQEYKDLIRRLQDPDTREYKIPASLTEILRPYQKEGYKWIRMLKSCGFGGILADEMGLGKTLQVLSFLLAEQEEHISRENRRTMIIAPASLIYNWQKEMETFTPALKSCVIAGNAEVRKKLIQESDADIFITSYDLLKRDIAQYEDISFANEIIDEAQYIKNQNTQTARGVRLLNSSFRLALTGTPVENRLSELWSIFDYLMPGFLYSYHAFRTRYEVPVVGRKDREVMERLRKMVHPFILRRMKKEVLTELPDKMEETVTIHLDGEQRKLYDAYVQHLKDSLERKSEEEFHSGRIEILAELTRLRQICCGPGMFLENYRGENAKKEACMELISQAVEGGHKVLLFSQFTTALDELCDALDDRKIPYHRLDGSTVKQKRIEMAESFAEDEVPVFCISLKAGGTGLNLAAADIVIHYDPWWNVAVQNQATDRAHRIGQKNTVTVYRLIADKTIEQQVVKLQQSKARLSEDLLSGDSISDILLRKEDLLEIL